MNEAKILEELITLDGKFKIDKWIEELNKNEKSKNEQVKNMMSNTNYINWLNQFIQDKNGFYTDEWLYFPEKIKDTDRENVEKLCLFYEGINKYAEQNHIYPTPCNFGNFYKVRLNEIGFGIGVLIGQGTVFFCKKVVVKNEQEFIDFNDIMTGKKLEQVDQIDARLNSLSKMVSNAYESGVPIESIVNTLENTINEITSKKEDISKTFIKK